MGYLVNIQPAVEEVWRVKGCAAEVEGLGFWVYG